MSFKNLSAAFVVVVLMVVAAPKSASAATIGFSCVTDNTLLCGGAADGNYVGEVNVVGNTLTTRIEVLAGGLGSITELYADFPAGYTFTFVPPFTDSGAGVSWQLGGSPDHLPGDNNATPPFDTNFVSSATGNTATGIQAGEWLELSFTTNPSILDLNALLLSGGLRFGLHVRAFDGETSEGLVSNCAIAECGGREGDPPLVTPEPASMLLLGTGLLAAARTARRRKTS